MNKTINISKKKLGYILMTVLSIGFLVCMMQITNATALNTNATALNTNDLNNVFNCITQKVNKSANITLADAFVCYDNTLPGAQKYASKPFQNPDLNHLPRNPDLNHLPKIQPVSSDTSTKTITNNKGIKSTWNPLDDVRKFKLTSKASDIFETKSSEIPSSNKSNFHFKNNLKDIKLINKHTSEKTHNNDVFAKAAESQPIDNVAVTEPNTFHNSMNDGQTWNLNNDNSGTKTLSGIGTPNIGSENQSNQDVSNLFNVNKKINHSTNPFGTTPNNLQTALMQTTISSSFHSDPIMSSFDLPFTSFGKK
ncbi:MAG TPA: hypothetical protein VN703_09085 [Candidatus Sulfopaludibacter sp.]|nr:hypothetical protein [Candidatus Sulfopaludibacter sp.]